LSKIIRSSDVITINDDSKQYRKADSIVAKSMEEAERILIDATMESEKLLRDSNEKAEKMVSDAVEAAREKAEALLEESRTRGYEEGKLEGYEIGYKDGHEEGYEKAYSETAESRKSIIEEANEIKKGYLEERERVLESLESEVIALVKEISEKVLNREMESESYMTDLILKGLFSLNDKDSLIIRVSKEDYQNVMDFKPEILSRGSLIDDIDIKLDSNLEKGDCVIESSQGNVNSSVSLQIEEMKKTLDDLLLGE
jgi:flagellar assembly protein FliH